MLGNWFTFICTLILKHTLNLLHQIQQVSHHATFPGWFTINFQVVSDRTSKLGSMLSPNWLSKSSKTRAGSLCRDNCYIYTCEHPWWHIMVQKESLWLGWGNNISTVMTVTPCPLSILVCWLKHTLSDICKFWRYQVEFDRVLIVSCE